MYGRLLDCKGIRAWWRDQRAVVYPACLRGHISAGLDGIRGSVPYRIGELLRSAPLTGLTEPGFAFLAIIVFFPRTLRRLEGRQTVYAAARGWYSSDLVSTAHAIRAFLLAMATVAMFVDRRDVKPAIQGDGALPV